MPREKPTSKKLDENKKLIQQEEVESQYILSQEKINKIKKEASSLNYEASLSKLDSILNDLENDNISVDSLHKYYLEGSIYLERCEKLLTNIEQEVIVFNKDDISIKE